MVAGDSAGGGLALALIHYLKDHKMPLPAGVVTMSAWTDLSLGGESYDTMYELDPLFGNSRHSMIYECSYIGDADVTDPYISPLYGDFTGFPPMLMQVGEHEMLLSDTIEAARKAREAGGRVRVSVYGEMFHVFQMCLNLIPESREAWAEVGEFLRIVYRIPRRPEGTVVRKVKNRRRGKRV